MRLEEREKLGAALRATLPVGGMLVVEGCSTALLEEELLCDLIDSLLHRPSLWSRGPFPPLCYCPLCCCSLSRRPVSPPAQLPLPIPTQPQPDLGPTQAAAPI